MEGRGKPAEFGKIFHGKLWALDTRLAEVQYIVCLFVGQPLAHTHCAYTQSNFIHAINDVTTRSSLSI